MNIGICVVTYNRLHSLKRLLKSLECAYYQHAVTLVISIDKSDTDQIEQFADNYEWKQGSKLVVKHAENLGLRKHILKCGDLLETFDALIVLEDDVSVAPAFYDYAEQCVTKYSDDERIAGISLYNFPINYHNLLPFQPLHSNSDVYLMQIAQSWGQVWMKKQWFAFKQWYLQNSDEFSVQPHLPESICSWPKSSWLKYHSRYCIEQNKFFIYPYVSFSTNNCDAGTHNDRAQTNFQSNLFYGELGVLNLTPTVVYDGFFENMNLHEYLPCDAKDLCVDFYGLKNNREQKRYWLTAKACDYQILSSYDLALKPLEWNIINGRKGQCIYLYDTHVPCTDRLQVDRFAVASFLTGNDYSLIKQIKGVVKQIMGKR